MTQSSNTFTFTLSNSANVITFKLPSIVTLLKLALSETNKLCTFKLPSIIVSCNNVSSVTVKFSFINTSFNSDNPDISNLPSKETFPSTSNLPSTFTFPSTSSFPSITVSCNKIVSSNEVYFLQYSMLFIVFVVTFFPHTFELQLHFVFVSFLLSFGIFI